jgi:hypothetical protein
METYYGIRNNVRNADTTTDAKSDIMTTAGDDVRILAKIVELSFVPISTTLAREMSGDSIHHGIRDIGLCSEIRKVTQRSTSGRLGHHGHHLHFSNK